MLDKVTLVIWYFLGIQENTDNLFQEIAEVVCQVMSDYV
jgi:hypothetical protein